MSDSKSAQAQTFFHVGYARAASTFLQKAIFPRLTGLQYIPRNRFRVREKEKKRFKADKVLMSREAGQNIFERCDVVKSIFDSRIVISVRRHDALAGSNYRLHVKRGHALRFDKYFDLENDQGFWKKEQFEYMRLIRYVEEKYSEKPIVLIFEDYIRDPDYYIEYMCAALGCGYDASKAAARRSQHKSYTDKQLRLRRQFADFLEGKNKDSLRDKTPQGDSFINFFKYKFMLLGAALFMRFAKFMPDSWLTGEPLIEPEMLKKVQEYYAQDWQECQQYVKEQNEALGIKVR